MRFSAEAKNTGTIEDRSLTIKGGKSNSVLDNNTLKQNIKRNKSQRITSFSEAIIKANADNAFATKIGNKKGDESEEDTENSSMNSNSDNSQSQPPQPHHSMTIKIAGKQEQDQQKNNKNHLFSAAKSVFESSRRVTRTCSNELLDQIRGTKTTHIKRRRPTVKRNQSLPVANALNGTVNSTLPTSDSTRIGLSKVIESSRRLTRTYSNELLDQIRGAKTTHIKRRRPTVQRNQSLPVATVVTGTVNNTLLTGDSTRIGSSKSRNYSATIIQRFYRGFQGRKRARRLKFKTLVKRTYNKKIKVKQQHQNGEKQSIEQKSGKAKSSNGNAIRSMSTRAGENQIILDNQEKKSFFRNNEVSSNRVCTTTAAKSTTKSIFEPIKRVARTCSNELMNKVLEAAPKRRRPKVTHNQSFSVVATYGTLPQAGNRTKLMQNLSAIMIQKYYRRYQCKKRVRRLRFKLLVKKTYNKKGTAQQDHKKRVVESMLDNEESITIVKSIEKDESNNKNRSCNNAKPSASAATSVFAPMRRVARTYSNDLMDKVRKATSKRRRPVVVRNQSLQVTVTHSSTITSSGNPAKADHNNTANEINNCSAIVIQKYYRSFHSKKRARKLRFKRLVETAYTKEKKEFIVEKEKLVCSNENKLFSKQQIVTNDSLENKKVHIDENVSSRGGSKLITLPVSKRNDTEVLSINCTEKKKDKYKNILKDAVSALHMRRLKRNFNEKNFRKEHKVNSAIIIQKYYRRHRTRNIRKKKRFQHLVKKHVITKKIKGKTESKPGLQKGDGVIKENSAEKLQKQYLTNLLTSTSSKTKTKPLPTKTIKESYRETEKIVLPEKATSFIAPTSYDSINQGRKPLVATASLNSSYSCRKLKQGIKTSSLLGESPEIAYQQQPQATSSPLLSNLTRDVTPPVLKGSRKTTTSINVQQHVENVEDEKDTSFEMASRKFSKEARSILHVKIIQRYWRGFQVRATYENQLKHRDCKMPKLISATLIVQKYWRKYKTKLISGKLIANDSKVQNDIKFKMEGDSPDAIISTEQSKRGGSSEKIHSVLRLQRLSRGYLAKNLLKQKRAKHEELSKIITPIQAVVRGYMQKLNSRLQLLEQQLQKIEWKKEKKISSIKKNIYKKKKAAKIEELKEAFRNPDLENLKEIIENLKGEQTELRKVAIDIAHDLRLEKDSINRNQHITSPSDSIHRLKVMEIKNLEYEKINLIKRKDKYDQYLMKAEKKLAHAHGKVMRGENKRKKVEEQLSKIVEFISDRCDDLDLREEIITLVA